MCIAKEEEEADCPESTEAVPGHAAFCLLLIPTSSRSNENMFVCGGMCICVQACDNLVIIHVIIL